MKIDINKKVRKMKDNGLNAGEDVVASLFLQPAGTLMQQSVQGGIGGLLGMFAARKIQQKQEQKQSELTNASEMADAYPKEPTVLAITTNGRVLCYSYNTIGGKPKSLVKEYEKKDIKVTNLEKGKLVHKMTLEFSDGGSLVFDVARGYDCEAFQSALQ
jgi:hypothetical protein